MAHMEGDIHVVTIEEALNYIGTLENNTKETPYKIKITGGSWENSEHTGILKNCARITDRFVDLSNTVFAGTIASMESSFSGCTSLVNAPVIPNGVTNMFGCFNACLSLVNAPVIPNGVTTLIDCFRDCRSLVNAPVIPNSVITLERCFYNCVSLTTASAIPDSVTDMRHTFNNCKNLVLAPVLPQGVANYDGCFTKCQNISSFLIPIKRSELTETTKIHFIEMLYDASTKKLDFVKDTVSLQKFSVPETVSTMPIKGKLIYLIGNNLTKDDARRVFIQSCLSTIQEGIKKIKQIRNAVIIGTKDKTNTFIKGVNLE